MVMRSKKLQQEGMDPLPSLEKAMSLVLLEQNKIISHTQTIHPSYS